jgi:predicted MFS family arabinose efflux permease
MSGQPNLSPNSSGKLTGEAVAPPPEAAPPAASWTAVASIGIGAFALVTSEFLPVGLLPQIARELAISPGQAGMMVTVPGVLAAFTAPLTLALAGRLDRRHVMLALLALLALSNLTVALAGSFAAVIAGRVMLGVAIGGFWTVGGSLGPRLRPGAAAATATAIIFSGVSVGTVAGVPIATLVGNMAGWRLAFGGATAVALVVLALLALVLPRIRPEPSAAGGVAGVLGLGKVQIGLAAIVLLFVGQFGSYTYITPYLLERAGMSSAAISPILFGYGVAGFAGNLLAGWSARRSVAGTLAGVAAVLGLSILSMLLAGTSAPLAVGMVLVWGVAFGMLPIAVQGWLFSAAPDRLESVSAVFVSSAQASIGAGALLGGLIVDHVGLGGAMGLGVAGGLATACLIAASTRKR